jgi:GNAT superfamily N-acetyltransferase
LLPKVYIAMNEQDVVYCRMMKSSAEAAGDASVTIYRQYDDGYIVRSMTHEDASVVQRWYAGMGTVSQFDLNVALSVFPASMRGFYIGEFEGKVVASAVRLPWGDDICYGSYYYVDKPYRSRGFGTRLRDEVAREHVGTKTLCVDAVMGKVAENNQHKFGYREAFKTGRFQCTAKSSYASSEKPVKILPVS